MTRQRILGTKSDHEHRLEATKNDQENIGSLWCRQKQEHELRLHTGGEPDP